jgi:Asp-tRNA(Asn)/Glu-tRNA(Gln) amidotransferase A subunit family amidase
MILLGSSGGSAGCVTKKCCLFALGTDLTGSVRGPASNCGLCGFMFAYNQISTKGIRNMYDGLV